MDIKTCCRCGAVKPIEEFRKTKEKRSGYLNRCIACDRVRITEYQRRTRPHGAGSHVATTPEQILRIREQAKRYYANHSKRCNETTSKYRQRNVDKTKAYASLKVALAHKTIIKPSVCSLCGIECVPNGHHENYRHPLEIIWVCDRCHTMIHVAKNIQSAKA